MTYLFEKLFLSILFTLRVFARNLHTYIIGHYYPSISIIDLVSHTTYVVFVYFIHRLRDLQFEVDSEWQIVLRNFSCQFYLLSEFLPEICWEKITEGILFVFYFDVWPGTRTLALHLINQHTTYYTTVTSISVFLYFVLKTIPM